MAMLAQLETGISAVNHAASQSDRWMFTAMLALVILGGIAVVRYLVKSIEKKDTAHAEERLQLAAQVKMERDTAKAENREERATAKAERKADQDAFLKVISGLETEIQKHTQSIEGLTKIVMDHDQAMRTAHSIEVSDLVRRELERLGISLSELPFNKSTTSPK